MFSSLTVFPELVEGLPLFFGPPSVTHEEQGQCFDKLSMDGFGLDRDQDL
jgi:hypothetical protein